MTREEAGCMAKVLQAFADGAVVQSKYRNDPDDNWTTVVGPGFNFTQFFYRVKPVEPDSIDWSHIGPDFKWMARDEDGNCYIYRNKPAIYSYFWKGGLGDDVLVNNLFTSYRRGTVDWTDSLVERPK